MKRYKYFTGLLGLLLAAYLLGYIFGFDRDEPSYDISTAVEE